MNDIDPASMLAAVGKRRQELIAQCPAPPADLTPEERAARPVNVIEVGNTGPQVLIVHGGIQGGLGGGPGTFDGQRPLANRGWQLRMVERPGFGQSPTHGADDMEADALWIADMLGEGAHLVGHSWGGAEALLAAARNPEAVRSLTLIEPALFPIVMADPVLRADPAMQGVAGRLAQLMLQSTTPAEYALRFAKTVIGPLDDPATQQRISGLEADPDVAHRVGSALLQGKMASPEAMRAAAQTVLNHNIPVLVISGGWSPFFDTIGEVVARFTGGTYEIIPASNHMVQEANPAAFNDRLDRFMRTADAK